MTAALSLFKVLLTVALIVGGAVLAVWLMVKGTQGLIWTLGGLGRGIAFLVGHTVRFVRNTIVDTFRALGAALTALVLLPLALMSLLFLRWKSLRHYGRALEDELVELGQGVYRVVIGNPLHFVGLGLLTEGLERRLPEVLARTPGGAVAEAAVGRFEGYEVEGELPAGGSGARLYLARPSKERVARFAADGHPDPGRVVIKAFSLQTGSTLPQIVRESRALEAAKQLGLVLDHHLSGSAFHYVMPYVPGEGLDVVAERLHGAASPAGLRDVQLRTVLGYAGDILYTLEAFHRGGLWHKDIKPSNVIVSEGRAHLVDLGLVTPLASAMTLTTHGTEYYRDPEMVRQALRGVKVHEVDGAKFDVYSTGAVLYSLLENSFPAQGSLSHLTKRCPDAVQWIVRRAMADLDRRYADAREMLVDIRTVLAAPDPWALRPADLPSVNGRPGADFPPADLRGRVGVSAATASAAPAPAARRSGRTDSARRASRRSVGRSVAAAAVGLFFLVGLLGTGAMLLGRVSMSHHADAAEQARVRAEELAREHSGRSGSAAEEATRAILDGLGASRRGGLAGWPSEGWNEFGLDSPDGEPLPAQALAWIWNRGLGEEIEALADGRSGSPRILVVNDAAPLPEEILLTLEQALREHGAVPIGPGPDRNSLDLEAELRRAAGLVALDDPEVEVRLADFSRTSDEVDAVLWLARGRQDGEPTLGFLLAAGEPGGSHAVAR
jgi:hypothetical protein